MFTPQLLLQAETLLAEFRAAGLTVATAESCTGGLICGLLTEVPGSSDVVDRGFVTYTNDAKTEMLGVHTDLLAAFGAVSADVARAMAEGALVHSSADIAVSVTGVAGPGGGSEAKPVGLVHFAAARIGAETRHEMRRFGDIGRSQVRLAAIAVALDMASEIARSPVSGHGA